MHSAIRGDIAPFLLRYYDDVANNFFLMGSIMCVGSNSWCRWLVFGAILFLSQFTLASALPKEIEQDTKFNRVMSQTVSNTFDRLSRSANSQFYELGKSVNDELFNKKKLSVIKNIAKANSGVIKGLGGLYLKNPLVGVAVSYGFGTFLDYALDNNDTGYAIAKKDNDGRYYVDVDDRGTIKRIYFEENNVNDSPYVKKPVIEDYYFSGECKGTSEDIVLSCIKEKLAVKELKKLNGGNWKVEDITLNRTNKKVSESGDVITYSLNYDYKVCLTDDSYCSKENRDLGFNVNRIKQKRLDQKKGKIEIKSVPLDEALSDQQEILSDKEDIAGFIRSALSVGSESLTPEERHLVSNISAEDVASTVPEENPSVTGADFKRFSYSDSMLKPNIATANQTRPSTEFNNKPNENASNERFEGNSELDYPELENPTARQILQPLQQFFPNLQRLRIQERGATCPVWSFEALNRTYTISSHCDLIEQYRSTLSSLFILIWSIVSLRKLLSA